MNPPNIKVYIIVSAVLIILFVIVSFFPFGRKGAGQGTPENFPTPTLVEGNQLPLGEGESEIIEAVDFTGAVEEEIPPEVYDAAFQKQELRNQTPFDTGLFQIDFDYSEDKFIITLTEPKGENRQQFNQWLSENYPGLNLSQFNFR